MTPFPLSPHDAATRWRVLCAGVCALVLTLGLARFAYTPLLPIMRAQADLSLLAGGWLAAINYAGYMSGVLLATAVSDVERKFRLYRIGLLLAVVCTAGMGLTTHVALWAALRFVAGLSSAAGMLLGSALVLNWLVAHRQRPELGIHFSGLGLGIAVSGLAVVGMVGWLPWDGQWLALGLLGVVFFIPAWRWMPRPATLPTTASTAAASAPPPSGRWMKLQTLAYFCAGFGFAIGATFTVAIVEKLPLLAGRGSWAWVVVGLAATPSTFVWDRIAQEISVARALMLAYALQALSALLPLLSDGVALNLISAALFGGTFVGIVSLTLALVGRHFPANPSKAMARITLGYGVAQIAAPAMGGMIARATGSYADALAVTTVILAAGVVLLQLLIQEERRTKA
ncbi:MAG TPA: YbfB/YjiJ family MFS transporter [Comamonas denitrificans]|nr:YbfB/YjiJ family MFS transporter [Comamonas denitrificans]HRM66887.1 YbfB/YjiJ family MFS transporter [Comamonas denitrificans]